MEIYSQIFSAGTDSGPVAKNQPKNTDQSHSAHNYDIFSSPTYRPKPQEHTAPKTQCNATEQNICSAGETNFTAPKNSTAAALSHTHTPRNRSEISATQHEAMNVFSPHLPANYENMMQK